MTDRGWVHVHKGLEGDDAKVGGLSVWKHQWTRVGSTDPLPHNGEAVPVYEIGGPPWPKPVTFAATEASNGVWSFWEPAP
ncbi:hypothetical protein [Brevundimonas goettingensis]|uniref:Uncharacterized protein n=1 Tax=Brevundimonas goettingensis TaxID=2774190 RepID=A0A975C2B5_9CAUL|nr:hypothetical protein [Brevundimonas goettingensis]QTC92551.1 hypothetical protein IFJ75_06685 [Brevundimonas goettingensis]